MKDKKPLAVIQMETSLRECPFCGEDPIMKWSKGKAIPLEFTHIPKKGVFCPAATEQYIEEATRPRLFWGCEDMTYMLNYYEVEKQVQTLIDEAQAEFIKKRETQ